MSQAENLSFNQTLRRRILTYRKFLVVSGTRKGVPQTGEIFMAHESVDDVFAEKKADFSKAIFDWAKEHGLVTYPEQISIKIRIAQRADTDSIPDEEWDRVQKGAWENSRQRALLRKLRRSGNKPLAIWSNADFAAAVGVTRLMRRHLSPLYLKLSYPKPNRHTTIIQLRKRLLWPKRKKQKPWA
jgi:hypothetical protein